MASRRNWLRKLCFDCSIDIIYSCFFQDHLVPNRFESMSAPDGEMLSQDGFNGSKHVCISSLLDYQLFLQFYNYYTVVKLMFSAVDFRNLLTYFKLGPKAFHI